MDLVDEEDAARLERREEGGDVGLALERRPGGLHERHVELGGDDPRRLARDGLVELGFSVVEADELLRDAPDDTPETLIANALRTARKS
jgi:hypothetical protein